MTSSFLTGCKVCMRRFTVPKVRHLSLSFATQHSHSKTHRSRLPPGADPPRSLSQRMRPFTKPERLRRPSPRRSHRFLPVYRFPSLLSHRQRLPQGLLPRLVLPLKLSRLRHLLERLRPVSRQLHRHEQHLELDGDPPPTEGGARRRGSRRTERARSRSSLVRHRRPCDQREVSSGRPSPRCRGESRGRGAEDPGTRCQDSWRGS